MVELVYQSPLDNSMSWPHRKLWQTTVNHKTKQKTQTWSRVFHKEKGWQNWRVYKWVEGGRLECTNTCVKFLNNTFSYFLMFFLLTYTSYHKYGQYSWGLMLLSNPWILLLQNIITSIQDTQLCHPFWILLVFHTLL